MTLLTESEILIATKGKAITNKFKNIEFDNVQTDSRNVVKNSLFVPLVGNVQDGHSYIPQSLEKGASVIFLNKSEFENIPSYYIELAKKYENVLFVRVKNTLHALQDLAEFYVEKFPDLIKISITGSSGKTTTKDMLVSIFSQKYKTVSTKGNFNSETGLPLSVFEIRSDDEVGIFELGMNRKNEIGEISKVLKSKYGIITNIGTAHIGILGSKKNIAKEKRKSFDYIPHDGAVFVPFEDEFCDFLCKKVKGKIIKYGTGISSKISGAKLINSQGLSKIEFILDGEKIKLPLSGLYNYSNALACIACAKEFGIETSLIKKGIEEMTLPKGRMEIQQVFLLNKKNVVLVKDFYNANPDSMEKSIKVCIEDKNSKKKFFVLGDMKELGKNSRDCHSQIGKILSECNQSEIFLLGSEMKNAYDVLLNQKFEGKVFYYPQNSYDDIKSISEKILCDSSENDLILLKGSNSMKIERIVPLLVLNSDEEKKL